MHGDKFALTLIAAVWFTALRAILIVIALNLLFANVYLLPQRTN
jgi:hypothetical protein